MSNNLYLITEMRSRAHSGNDLTTDELSDAAIECLFNLESMLTILSLIGDDLPESGLTIQTYCAIARSFNTTAIVYIEKLEEARKEGASDEVHR